jgi:hypothetical protein
LKASTLTLVAFARNAHAIPQTDGSRRRESFDLNVVGFDGFDDLT